METLYVSPAIVALFIFYYMRKKQAARNEKQKERLWQSYQRLIQTLQANKNETE